uniref:DNA repair protein UVH3 n=1 Tax=Nelumbo nucifera TaxID=4432 RepID=A0A822YHQ7_NELNU|nr:TPA_asm: hypothetical protein HUJ06_009862 [Nelumbo nucifera]
MGVQGLWELLAPVGRRVSVETLAGKRLAIDASIWMIQFMKAMRDEKGEMVRNAHLIGFFRRICKLLFLRTKPVFVFDGGTPALKRRTVIARRRQRDIAQAKIRKTAEKLLLNHLKAMKLKELAEDIEKQKQNNDSKGKNVVPDHINTTENIATNDTLAGGYNQESLDELLAASIAAEEDGSLTINASTSIGGIPPEEDDSDDEEMMLPIMHGNVDPAVLAALPPSMQLDLLVQMRERLMAENRQKYQKVKKAPAKFSELQIQAYLKTVAFRREIDEVQKSAAGRGIGGVQTSRIASEANREFIFSSSFTGNKEMLTSAGVNQTGGGLENQTVGNGSSFLNSVNCSSAAHCNSAMGSAVGDSERGFEDDVETYLDERGCVRVSRLRAMGIRMTRDLQRNLDLMKEIEQEKMREKNFAKSDSIVNEVLRIQENTVKNNQHGEASNVGNNLIGEKGILPQGDNHHLHEHSILGNGNTMVISFEDDVREEHAGDANDDDVFARLVVGDSVMIPYTAITSSEKQPCDVDSDCSWEEGNVKDVNKGSHECFSESNINDDSELDWEGVCNYPENVSPPPTENKKTVSKGCLEEAAEIQEAIKRNLEDFRKEKPTGMHPANIEITTQDTAFEFPAQVLDLVKDTVDSLKLPLESNNQQIQSSYGAAGEFEKLNNVVSKDVPPSNDTPMGQLSSSMALGETNEKETLTDELYLVPGLQSLSQEESEKRRFSLEKSNIGPVSPIEPKEIHLASDKKFDAFDDGGALASVTEAMDGSSRDDSHVSATELMVMPDDSLVGAAQHECGPVPCSSHEVNENIIPREEISVEKMENDVEIKNNPVTDEKYDAFSDGRTPYRDKSVIEDNMEVHIEASRAILDDEMQTLSQERMHLGEEQRKLERNAESVSGEMFAECQELLQMFGLPYIIAPMEAEAQCAYMELANLVDGVVTDDSDVFLFGARSVYKNIFDDRKYVETYFMKDIESELGLTREKLIHMALLLGSDYTEGISGIGIVNAIEVVHAFPEEDGLQKFKEWLESPDPSILEKFDAHSESSSRKKLLKVNKNDVNYLEGRVQEGPAFDGSVPQGQNDRQSMDNIQNIKQIFMNKHRNVSKNWHIPSSFPSEMVVSAYASPQVDKSTEPFSWGKPDLFALRKLCWEKFGWSNQKADELLLPVLKEYNKHETQLRLEAFYTFNERFAKIRSQRIKRAVKGITGNRTSELDDLLCEASKVKNRSRVNPLPEEKRSNISLNGNGDSSAELPSKWPRRRGTESKSAPSEVTNSAPPFQMDSKKSTKKRLKRDTGGRQKGKGAGRGRGKQAPNHDAIETSSTDSDNSWDEQEMQVEKTEGLPAVRRSTRLKKQVEYAVKDLEIDGLGESSERTREEFTTEETVEQETSAEENMFGDIAHGVEERNQCDQSNPSLKDGSCRDYLEMGGGFCMDKTEGFLMDEAGTENRSTQFGSSLNRSSNPDGDFSPIDGTCGDYLKMGGGFCIDECDPDTPIDSVSSPTRSLEGHLSGERKMDAVHITQSLDCLNTRMDDDSGILGVSLEGHQPDVQDQKDDSRPTSISVSGLSAMPFLRKRRRT